MVTPCVMVFELLLLIAIFLDLIFGEPKWGVHPVQVIGAIAKNMEKFCRFLIAQEFWSGALTFLLTFIISVGSINMILLAAGHYSVVSQTFVAVGLLYLFVAIKGLLEHSKAVHTALVSGNLDQARKAVGKIVGRDTDHMESEEVCRACIETVAENFVDGIVAPLFWALLFSLAAPLVPMSPISLAAIGMTAYKTINTMDSMFGYKNDTYLKFGTVAARVDDVANWVPARISGLCIVGGAFILRQNYRNSFSVLREDRLNHASPNAGHPEAAVAGAIGVQLGGPARYFGRTVAKPWLGKPLKTLTAPRILQVYSLILTSTFIFIGCSLALRALLLFFFTAA